MPKDFSIGEVARTTGVNIQTIRFYEARGLLPAPPRSVGNRRRYDDAHVARLVFIRHARELGFAVAAITDLIGLSASPGDSCARVDAIAREQLAAVESRLSRLALLKAELERMIGQCAGGRIADCRVIESLGHHTDCAAQHGGAGVKAAPAPRSSARP